MDVIAEIEDTFIDEIDRQLLNDNEYQDAIKKVFDFLKYNLPDSKESQYNDLINKLLSDTMRISFATGMKLGAKIATELLK